jgi:hypothetical protein
VLDYLSLLIAHSAPTFLSFHPISVVFLLVLTSESRHHFSLCCTVPPPRYSGISSVIHLSYSLLYYLDSLSLSLLSCLSVSLFLSLNSTFFRFPFALNLSTSLSSLLRLHVLFLFSPAFCEYPALFPSIHFICKLCRALSRFHSPPIPLVLFPDYVTK